MIFLPNCIGGGGGHIEPCGLKIGKSACVLTMTCLCSLSNNEILELDYSTNSQINRYRKGGPENGHKYAHTYF